MHGQEKIVYSFSFCKSDIESIRLTCKLYRFNGGSNHLLYKDNISLFIFDLKKVVYMT
jgi:hypothetical protein